MRSKKSLVSQLYLFFLAVLTAFFWFKGLSHIGIYVLFGLAVIGIFIFKSIVYSFAPLVFGIFMPNSPNMMRELPNYAYLFILGYLVLLLLFKKKKRKKSFFGIGVASITIAAMVSGSNNIGSQYSLILLGVGVLVIVFYYGVYYATIDGDKERLLFLMKWIGILITFQIATYYFQNGSFLDIASNQTLKIGWSNENQVGMALLATTPITLYHYFKEDSKDFISGLAFIFQTWGIVLTYSRGSVLSFLVILILVIGFLFVYKPSRLKTFVLLSVSFGTLFIFMYYARGNYKIVFDLKYFFSLSNDNGRFNLYKQALDVIKNYPIFGEGFNVSGFNLSVIKYYHSTPLQFLASLGGIGLFALIVHVFIKYFTVLKKFNLVSFFVLLSFLGPSLYGLIDVTFFSLPYLILLVVLIIISELNYSEKKPAPRRVTKPL